MISTHEHGEDAEVPVGEHLLFHSDWAAPREARGREMGAGNGDGQVGAGDGHWERGWRPGMRGARSILNTCVSKTEYYQLFLENFITYVFYDSFGKCHI